MEGGTERCLVSSFITAGQVGEGLPDTAGCWGGGVFSLAGGQSTAWGFCDMSFPGFSSLAMSCYQSQPSPEMDREPTGLGQSKDQTYYYFISFHLLRVSTSSHTRKGGGTEGEGQGEPHACSMPREEPDMSLDLTTLRS